MLKPIPKVTPFKVHLTPSELAKPYELVIAGDCYYLKFPGDPYCTDSDQDFYGYYEFQTLDFNYIIKVTEDKEEYVSIWDLPAEEYELFAQKLNIRMGF